MTKLRYSIALAILSLCLYVGSAAHAVKSGATNAATTTAGKKAQTNSGKLQTKKLPGSQQGSQGATSSSNSTNSGGTASSTIRSRTVPKSSTGVRGSSSSSSGSNDNSSTSSTGNYGRIPKGLSGTRGASSSRTSGSSNDSLPPLPATPTSARVPTSQPGTRGASSSRASGSSNDSLPPLPATPSTSARVPTNQTGLRGASPSNANNNDATSSTNGNTWVPGSIQGRRGASASGANSDNNSGNNNAQTTANNSRWVPGVINGRRGASPSSVSSSAGAPVPTAPQSVAIRSTTGTPIPAKTYKALNTKKRFGKNKQVFSSRVVKLFDYRKIDNWSTQNGDASYTPTENQGDLGKFLGGGANAKVYQDKNSPDFVQKLVRLTQHGGKLISESGGFSSSNTVTDQTAGHEILNRLKQTYANKTLYKLFDVAQREPVSILEVKAPNGSSEYYAKTREQNITSSVYRKSAAGPAVRVLGDDGNPESANNAEDRLELRIKDKIRADALKNGNKIRLADIKVERKAIGEAITPAEEATLSAVIRGLNRQGIVWTDHKLANIDIVPDAQSPTRHKVIFFDFDGFRPVTGKTIAERANNARRLQLGYDHDPSSTPAPNKPADEKKVFDYTAFDTAHLYTATSANANVHRTTLKSLNDQDAQTFNQSFANVSNGRVTGLLNE